MTFRLIASPSLKACFVLERKPAEAKPQTRDNTKNALIIGLSVVIVTIVSAECNTQKSPSFNGEAAPLLGSFTHMCGNCCVTSFLLVLHRGNEISIVLHTACQWEKEEETMMDC